MQGKNIDTRLAALESYLQTLQAHATTFLLADGQRYTTALEPLDYLQKYGAYTPDGLRIVFYPHPVAGVDALSLALYQLIDECVAKGRVDWPKLESDPV